VNHSFYQLIDVGIPSVFLRSPICTSLLKNKHMFAITFQYLRAKQYKPTVFSNVCFIFYIGT